MSHPDYDVRRGQATIRDENGYVVATLLNMGGEAAIDLPTGFLDPHTARQLGHALISWSAWKRHVTDSIDHYQRTAQPPATATKPPLSRPNSTGAGSGTTTTVNTPTTDRSSK